MPQGWGRNPIICSFNAEADGLKSGISSEVYWKVSWQIALASPLSWNTNENPKGDLPKSAV